MILTEDYVRKTIEEVAPLVEEESGLKTNLENYVIKLEEKLEFSNPTFKSIGTYVLANYNYSNKEFSFLKNFPGNKDFLREFISHEIMHNAQDFIPNFHQKRNNSYINYVNHHIGLTDFRYLKEYWVIKKLSEGDATLIQRKMVKKYFKNPKKNLLGLSIIPSRLILPENRLSWADSLNKKFNDGKDRKGINELYSAPFNELEKIFGGK